MKMRKVRSLMCAFAMAIIALFLYVDGVNAATTTITLETENYEVNNGDKITVRVYLNSDTNIGAYHTEIVYDSYRLEYVSGADSVNGDNKVILEGTGYGGTIVYKLVFKAISGGKAELSCGAAEIRVEGSKDSAKQNISYSGNIGIVVAGEDTAVKEQNIEKYGIESNIPICGVVDTKNGERYYIIDHFRYIPEIVDFEYHTVRDVYDNATYTFLSNAQNDVKILYMMDKNENFVMYAYSKTKKALYPCEVVESEGTKYYVMSPNACDNWAEALTLDYVKRENICYAMRIDGTCGFYKYDDGLLTLWTEDEGQAYLDEQMDLFVEILLITVSVVVIIVVAILINARIRQQQRKLEKDQHFEYIEDNAVPDSAIEFITVEDTNGANKREEKSTRREKPVIAIKDVTMKFRISTSSASGLKELFIQKVKKECVSRVFTALNHVSINIYKGEVVGIIGTNGSGKSTLLKIVSGALNPTSGKINVDKRKVQLLSLGTGFDKELTARENIYLSGAIIGYSKEFIDANFNEIIKFAELQDFVDEKVKNFSSGMVSRLGFAIATVGDAAEILILDEILSVGDEFFKKKSLKRIKEMMHSGSTVIMVSHGMNTIMENCTKVVWLEKGKVKMIGDPKVVCKAYRKYSK